jgi:hypothetical protein
MPFPKQRNEAEKRAIAKSKVTKKTHNQAKHTRKTSPSFVFGKIVTKQLPPRQQRQKTCLDGKNSTLQIAISFF